MLGRAELSLLYFTLAWYHCLFSLPLPLLMLKLPILLGGGGDMVVKLDNTVPGGAKRSSMC